MASLPHVAWVTQAIRREPANRPRLLVNDADVVLHALSAGLGKSLLPRVIGERTAGLTQIGGPVLSRELWLIVHPDLRHLTRIKVVTDWIVATVAKLAR